MTDLEAKNGRAESILRKAYLEGDVIVARTHFGNLRVEYRYRSYRVIDRNGVVLASGQRKRVKGFLVNSCLVVVRSEASPE